MNNINSNKGGKNVYNKDKLRVLINELLSYIEFNEKNITDKTILYELLKRRVIYVCEKVKNIYKI